MKNNAVFVLLAGGKSERMGVAKGLLKYKQTYWILEQLNRVSKSDIKEVYIGFGYNYQHYFKAIPWIKSAITNFENFQGLKVKTVINPAPRHGSFSTLQAVLKKVNPSNSLVINPIDIPLVKPSELNKIISTNNEIVLPSFEGKNGHPIKLNYNFWYGLLSLNAKNEEARLDVQIKNTSPSKISIVEVFDNAVLKNLNTKKDWISFLEEDS
jgi:CTP:molybdopterin cytidylyltransferase MocA